jgi:hypothetical protein
VVEWDAWYGLGLELGDVGRPHPWFGHASAFPFGWWGDSRAYPTQDFALVVFTNKWDAMRWFNPPATIAPGLIAEFVSRWLDRGGSSPRRRAAAWQASYLMGALLAERVYGVLGVPSRLDRDELARLSLDARSAAGVPPACGWDPDGFVAGVRAIEQTPLDPAALRALVGSDRFDVPSEEIQALCLELGVPGAFPVPMPFWA